MRIRIAAAALAAATAPFAANAEENPDVRITRVVVVHGDLDLETVDGARVMAERLHRAARRACGGSPLFDPHYDIAHAWAIAAFEDCYAAAMDAALSDLRAPLVAQAHARMAPNAGGSPHGAYKRAAPE